MKTMTTSLLFVAVLAAIFFVLIWFLTGDIGDAKGGAAFAVAGLPSISSWIEQLEAKRSSVPGAKMAIRSFEGFSISFPAAIAFGAIVAIAVINLSGAFVGFIAGAIGAVAHIGEDAEGDLLRTASIGNIPIICIGFYLFGRWLGARTRKHGLYAVGLAVLIASVTTRLADFFLLPAETWRSLFRMDAGVRQLLLLIAMQVALIAGPTLLGFWRGRKMRLSRYMAYLLSALPEETRDSLLDLAYEEVKQKVAAQRAAPPRMRMANATA